MVILIKRKVGSPSVKKAVNTFRRLEKSQTPAKGAGVHAFFEPITEKWGAKIYFTKEKRDGCYERQEMAYAEKIAPKLGVKFEYVTRNGIKYYGFTTQIAQHLGRKHPLIDPDKCDSKHTRLCNRLEEMGLDEAANDLHEGNWGWIGRRMVCIDFSTHADDYYGSSSIVDEFMPYEVTGSKQFWSNKIKNYLGEYSNNTNEEHNDESF